MEFGVLPLRKKLGLHFSAPFSTSESSKIGAKNASLHTLEDINRKKMYSPLKHEPREGFPTVFRV